MLIYQRILGSHFLVSKRRPSLFGTSWHIVAGAKSQRNVLQLHAEKRPQMPTLRIFAYANFMYEIDEIHPFFLEYQIRAIWRYPLVNIQKAIENGDL